MRCLLDFLSCKWTLWILFVPLCIAKTAGTSVIQHAGTCTLQQSASACTFSLLCYLAGGLPVEGCGQGSSSTCCLLKATSGLLQLLEQLDPLVVNSNPPLIKSLSRSEDTPLNTAVAITDASSAESKSITNDFDTVQESSLTAGLDSTTAAESIPMASIVYASSPSDSSSSSGPSSSDSTSHSISSARLLYPSHASLLAATGYKPPSLSSTVQQESSSRPDHTYVHQPQTPSSSAHLSIHHQPTYHHHQHHPHHPHHSHSHSHSQHHPHLLHHHFHHLHQHPSSPLSLPQPSLHHSHLNHHNHFTQQLHQLPSSSGHQPSALSASLQRHLLSQLHMPLQLGDHFASSLYASGEHTADSPSSTPISSNSAIGPTGSSSSFMREEAPPLNGHYGYGGLSSSSLYAATHNDFSSSGDFVNSFPIRSSSFAPSLRSASGPSFINTPDTGHSASGLPSFNSPSNSITPSDHRTSPAMSPTSPQSPPISTTIDFRSYQSHPILSSQGSPSSVPSANIPTLGSSAPSISLYPQSVDYVKKLRYPTVLSAQQPLVNNNNPNLPMTSYPNHFSYSTVPARNDIATPSNVINEEQLDQLNGSLQHAEPDENGFTPSEQEYATNAIRRSRLAASSLNSIHNERQTHARNFIGEDVCGKPLSKPTSRIIGGQDAYFGEFPWQVHIKISKHQCGGALLNRDFCITAAHCVYQAPLEQLTIIIGAHDIEEHRYQAEPPQYLEVESVLLHPHFRFSAAHPDRFDVALLKLKRPASYTGAVRPVCLPPKQLKLEGWRAVVTGWGKTDTALTNRYGTRLLQKVDVPIIKNHECEKWHRTRGIDLKIFPEMMCAGYEDGQKDACVGDSGGPLVIFLNGRWTLAGITSAGFGCAQSRQPGIYHRVSHTVDWILENMNTSLLHRAK